MNAIVVIFYTKVAVKTTFLHSFVSLAKDIFGNYLLLLLENNNKKQFYILFANLALISFFSFFFFLFTILSLILYKYSFFSSYICFTNSNLAFLKINLHILILFSTLYMLYICSFP